MSRSTHNYQQNIRTVNELYIYACKLILGVLDLALLRKRQQNYSVEPEALEYAAVFSGFIRADSPIRCHSPKSALL